MTMTVYDRSRKPLTQRPRYVAGGLRGIHVLWIVFGTILLSVALTCLGAAHLYLCARLPAGELSAGEQQTLNQKLRVLGYDPAPVTFAPDGSEIGAKDLAWVTPERYTEKGAKREVEFSERELNSMVANNPDLAKKLAVDLAEDLVSARLLVPVRSGLSCPGWQDTARFGRHRALRVSRGETGRCAERHQYHGRTGAERLAGRARRIRSDPCEFGDERGFWKGFADGVEHMRVVEDGLLRIKLKE